jgi:hypothetical protein
MYTSKLTSPSIVSIEDFKSHRTGKVFIGDIMVIYNTYLDKAH